MDMDLTHRMMMLVIQLGIILFAARLGGMMFEKLRLPRVLGELCAGIIIGPYLLGGIPIPGFEHGLFPQFHGEFPVSPELYGICSVAAVVLLFMVGLETDIKLFIRYSLAGSLVGIGGVVTSFVLGDLAAVFLLGRFFGHDLEFFSPACLLLGVITTATSVGITARVLSGQRKLDSPEGVTILAGAVVDDVLGIILLAISLGLISASRESGTIEWAHIGAIAAKAVGIWLAATIIGLAASRQIGVLLKWFRDRSSIAVMALGLALILAGLFEEAKLAMIIGAYVMGLSLSRTDINYVIRENMAPIHSFLVPVFFVVMGMMVDLRLFLSGDIIMFGVVFTALAIVAKILGCGIPALFCNFNMLGALRIGCGMLPRGEVTLIIAGVGFAGGHINSEMFGAVVFMTLVTTLAAPVVLHKLFAIDATGLRREKNILESEKISFSFPSEQTADLLMRKLLGMFESNGFFVHLVDRALNHFQLRKDDVVINVLHGGPDILFECGAQDTVLVNTAMLEVVAELEQIMEELKKPIDKQAIRQKASEDTGAGKARARELARYLSRDVLVPGLEGATREEVIDELLSVLEKSEQVKDIDQARSAVMSREKSMSTGMQHGIAIPHGRTDAVNGLICAVGVSKTGIDFSAIDGAPSRIIVLTLSPVSGATPHVQFMSMVSQVLNSEGREALLACRTSDEMFKVLTGRMAPKEIEALKERSSVLELSENGQDKRSELTSYLRADHIKTELTGRNKTEVINELLDLLKEKQLINNLKSARSAVMAREKRMPSGLAHGVAIPHARTNAVGELVCAMGIRLSGVDFGAMDGEPCSIIVLTLSPKDIQAPHVQFMAMMSRALDEAGRKRVLAAGTPEEVLSALRPST